MAAGDDVERLRAFIDDAKARGLNDAAIGMILRHEGWSERKVQDALVANYRASLGVEIPARGGRAEIAREAFFYLLSFLMLAVWAVALVWLADLLADHAFPDQLQPYSYEYSRQSVAGQLASLMVAYPIFLWINLLLRREIATRPEALDSSIRKWLTYIALVIAAVTLVFDGVAFLSAFLTGDLTARFIVKALVLLAVAGGIFWYYLGTVREDVVPDNSDRAFGAAATVAVLAAIVLGFTGIGSPSHQRDVTADEQRVQNLTMLASAIMGRTQFGKRPLPSSLSELSAWSGWHDPITNQPYGYQSHPGGTRYQLCATFSTSTLIDQPYDAWKHPAGLYCYAIDASSAIPVSGG
jgi:hypothetical protein